MLRITRGLSLKQAIGVRQAWDRSVVNFRGYATHTKDSSGLNAPIQNRKPRKDEGPRIRYLLYVFFFSSGLLVLATNLVNKKKVPQTTFTEREYQEYERESGIKRRNKLISGASSDKYHFYAVPYVETDESLNKVISKLPKNKEVKVIDPDYLIQRETEDSDARYSILLNDLKQTRKPIPRGLVTALIKQELELFLNTSKGIYDTNIVLKNYPQSTYEASKFENDISDIRRVIVLKDDIEKDFPTKKRDEDVRLINNVVGYYDTVGKNYELTGKCGDWDEKMIEVEEWQ